MYLREIASELELSYDSLKQDCNLLRASMQKNNPEGDNNDNRWNNGRHKKGKCRHLHCCLLTMLQNGACYHS